MFILHHFWSILYVYNFLTLNSPTSRNFNVGRRSLRVYFLLKAMFLFHYLVESSVADCCSASSKFLLTWCLYSVFAVFLVIRSLFLQLMRQPIAIPASVYYLTCFPVDIQMIIITVRSVALPKTSSPM